MINEKDEKNCCTSKPELDPNCCVEEVGQMMQKLVRVFQLIEKDKIKLLGFTYTQCYCMLELQKSSSLSMQELSSRMNLDNSTMTRIIDKLVRDNYIERSKDESDRRIVVVKLTDKGKAVADKLNTNITEYYRQIINNIPEGQLFSVLDSVTLLLNTFEKIHPNCC